MSLCCQADLLVVLGLDGCVMSHLGEEEGQTNFSISSPFHVHKLFFIKSQNHSMGGLEGIMKIKPPENHQS